MRFIDAHHHLWDLSHCDYPWLMARGVKRFFGDPAPIQKNYLIEDFLSESAAWVPEMSVHIQVGTKASHSLRESQWVQSQAEGPTSQGQPNAIVAFVDLAAADAAEVIAQQSSVANVRGVRQIIGRHADEDRALGSIKLWEDEAWRRGLRSLEEAGLSFDLQLTPPQHKAVAEVFRQHPALPVALCHCGSPWDQSRQGLLAWREGMERFAALPNVYCKISGLGMFNPGWQCAADLQPIVATCIELFGTERIMFGSNYPVDKLYRPYADIWSAYAELISSFSGAEQDAMFYGNASGFYRMRGHG
jgi:predicted TIM-barrel fold metal-dependent hydrolase